MTAAIWVNGLLIFVSLCSIGGKLTDLINLKRIEIERDLRA